MKRLKIYFSQLERNDENYEKIYTGAYAYTKDGIVYGNAEISNAILDPTYWKDDISYTLEKSHRTTLDMPVVKIRIPIYNFGIKQFDNDEGIIFSDFVLRCFNKYVDEFNSENYNRSRTDKQNGAIYSYHPTSEVLLRNASYIEDENNEVFLNLIIMVQLPMHNHKKGMNILCRRVPDIVIQSINNFEYKEYCDSVRLYKLQQQIRDWLNSSPYCAFIANGSLLPREKLKSGPKHDSLPFQAPIINEIEVAGYKGLGIPRGVTVITGGGYSGKSTLLEAISSGIYNHIRGDGRELCISDSSAVNIYAEDGRCIRNVNISPFIQWIPNGDTNNFSTDQASGSTSQAANIIEAVNAGSKLLLIDEDKTATNFMIRDKYMKQIIKKEPIIPFTDRVRQLYNDIKVSTIIVIGGSSEYFMVADTILMMEEYNLKNITDEAKRIRQLGQNEENGSATWYSKRKLLMKHFSSYPDGSGTEILDVSDFGFILFGDERIDIRKLSPDITSAQYTAITFILRNISQSTRSDSADLDMEINNIHELIEKNGLEFLYSSFFKIQRWLEIPRRFDVLAVINRMKNISFKTDDTVMI